MNKEADRREQILNRESESLTLVHVEIDAGNLTLTLQNNGTSDIRVSYVKINESDFNPLSPEVELDYGQSTDVTVPISGSLHSVEVGTTLGKVFVFNAPSAQIRVINTFFDASNKLVTFSGEGSTDDGRIAKWDWCFNWDETSNVCNANCSTLIPGLAVGTGEVTSYSYVGANCTTPAAFVVRLVVTDDTGMTGEVLITIYVP
jgi:hypothetical protein